MTPTLAAYSPERLRTFEEDYSVFCVVHLGEQRLILRVVNFHYRSASLLLEDAPGGPSLAVGDQFKIDFHAGRECLLEGWEASLSWLAHDAADRLLVGVRFPVPIVAVVEKAWRIIIPPAARPTLVVADPVRAAATQGRMLDFTVLDISMGGMLLRIAEAEGRHLFVGMVLEGAELRADGEVLGLRAEVENIRCVRGGEALHVGISVADSSGRFIRLCQGMARYRASKRIIDPRARERADRLLSRSGRDLELRALAGAADLEAYAGLGGGAPPRAVGAFLKGRLVAAVGYAPGEAFHVHDLLMHPKIISPELLVALVQMTHALALSSGATSFQLPTPDESVDAYLELGVVDVTADARGGRRLELGGDWFSDEYLNPMVWSAVATLLMNRFAARSPKTRYGLVHAALKLLGLGPAAHAAAQQKAYKASSFVDLRWTEPHFLAVGIYPYLLAADELIGADVVDAIVRRSGLTRAYFRNEGNWVSVAFLDHFLKEAAGAGAAPEALSIAAARRFLQPDVMGIMYYVARAFVSPRQAFQAFEIMLPRFDRSKVYRLSSVGKSHASVAIAYRSPALVPEHRAVCCYWQESFLGYVKLLTGRDGEVTKTSCVYDGAPTCTYDITWRTGREKLRAPLVAGGAAAAGLAGSRFNLPPAAAGALVGGVAAGGVIAAALVARYLELVREHRALAAASDEHQKKATERYAELFAAKAKLDHRYREARLLEEIAQLIQGGDDVLAILEVLLQNICIRFGYERAFAFRADPDAQRLELFASSSPVKTPGPIRIDLGADADNVFASVFQTGMAALINDAENRPLLFAGGAALARGALDLKRCAIVPIQAARRHGVLIVEKAPDEGRLSKTDVVLLKRAAQQAAMALDKQARIDFEVKLRSLFQRYVPARVIDLALSRTTPRLPGEVLTVACMFVDIRNFTKMSEISSPAATLDMLNRVLGLVNAAAVETGGLVEKFLGDGALLTWGALGQSDAAAAVADHCRAAFRTAQAIRVRLGDLNEHFAALGLPIIKLGVGMHVGGAIVGNVGPEERLEYTSIGSTINLASRLEGLCKLYGAEGIASREFIEHLRPEDRAAFGDLIEVEVRGFSAKMVIGRLGVGEGTKLVA